MGRVLPTGLVGDGWFFDCTFIHNVFLHGIFINPGATRASVAAGFATVSKFGLVVRRLAGDRGAGYEQLSVDDGH